jgi:hypothetical protein
MAADSGMPFMRAYSHAPDPSNTHPRHTKSVPAASSPRLSRAGDVVIAVIIALTAFVPLRAADAPPDLGRRVAHRESETAEERRHYAYTQSVRLQELDRHGVQAGEYREVREVIFSPTGERTERFPAEPVSHLKNLILTQEDFADLRDIQPFVMTEDQLALYQVEYKGEEEIEGQNCWVLSVRPREILSGQRLFEGLLWAKQDDYSVIRSEGKAVPEIVTTKRENLFPHFTTVRKQVNGFWFPATTSADDTLYFRNAPIREKLVIRYDEYKKFGSETTITFDK